MMKISSSAFIHNGMIPPVYTCDAEMPLSPPLTFTSIPEKTLSLVLIMDDPDVPRVVRDDGVFDHWILFNIPPKTQGIEEGGSIGMRGMNSAGRTGYVGPCPPPQYQPKRHRYFFRLYALDTVLSISEDATKEEVLTALTGHVIEEAELIGQYERS